MWSSWDKLDTWEITGGKVSLGRVDLCKVQFHSEKCLIKWLFGQKIYCCLVFRNLFASVSSYRIFLQFMIIICSAKPASGRDGFLHMQHLNRIVSFTHLHQYALWWVHFIPCFSSGDFLTVAVFIRYTLAPPYHLLPALCFGLLGSSQLPNLRWSTFSVPDVLHQQTPKNHALTAVV